MKRFLVLISFLSFCGLAAAQPAGGGWVQCAVLADGGCQLPASQDLRQWVAWASSYDYETCTYGEPRMAQVEYVQPVDVQQFYGFYPDNYCYQTGAYETRPYPVFAGYVRTLHAGDPEPGEYQCTAAICSADGAFLSWAVVLTWATVWGLRRLMVHAADDE